MDDKATADDLKTIIDELHYIRSELSELRSQYPSPTHYSHPSSSDDSAPSGVSQSIEEAMSNVRSLDSDEFNDLSLDSLAIEQSQRFADVEIDIPSESYDAELLVADEDVLEGSGVMRNSEPDDLEQKTAEVDPSLIDDAIIASELKDDLNFTEISAFLEESIDDKPNSETEAEVQLSNESVMGDPVILENEHIGEEIKPSMDHFTEEPEELLELVPSTENLTIEELDESIDLDSIDLKDYGSLSLLTEEYDIEDSGDLKSNQVLHIPDETVAIDISALLAHAAQQVVSPHLGSDEQALYTPDEAVTEGELNDEQALYTPDEVVAEGELSDEQALYTPDEAVAEGELSDEQALYTPDEAVAEGELSDEQALYTPDEAVAEGELSDEQALYTPDEAVAEGELSDEQALYTPDEAVAEGELSDEQALYTPDEVVAEGELSDEQALYTPDEVVAEGELSDEQALYTPDEAITEGELNDEQALYTPDDDDMANVESYPLNHAFIEPISDELDDDVKELLSELEGFLSTLPSNQIDQFIKSNLHRLCVKIGDKVDQMFNIGSTTGKEDVREDGFSYDLSLIEQYRARKELLHEKTFVIEYSIDQYIGDVDPLADSQSRASIRENYKKFVLNYSNNDGLLYSFGHKIVFITSGDTIINGEVLSERFTNELCNLLSMSHDDFMLYFNCYVLDHLAIKQLNASSGVML